MHELAYVRPSSLSEALILAEQEPEARYIAGGTNLMDLMKLGVQRPPVVIDLSGIAGLDIVTVSATEVELGALVSMSDAAEDPVLCAEFPALRESLLLSASQQLRNMATLGGNLLQRTRCGYFRDISTACNKRAPGSGCAALHGIHRAAAVLGTSQHCIAAYPGDFATALIAFDARIRIASPAAAGTRTIALAALHRVPADRPDRETTLAEGEIITAIVIPRGVLGRASSYVKVRDRASYEFALASAAAILDLDTDDLVTDCRIAVGGVATRPWRADEAERLLMGRRLTPRLARSAAEQVFAHAHPREQNAHKIGAGIAAVTEALLIAHRRFAA